MQSQLAQRIDETSTLQTKLILLIGRPGSGKSEVLKELAAQRAMEVINLGATLGQRLALLSQRQRPLQTNIIMRELVEANTKNGLALIDNLELLFDPSLKLSPLDQLKRQAQGRCIVASWPGELHDGRLTYAQIGHPEHQDYGLEGLIPLNIESMV